VKAPRGWKIASGLDRRGARLSASDYDLLVDCPIEIGTFVQRTFKVAACRTTSSSTARGNYDEKRMVDDVPEDRRDGGEDPPATSPTSTTPSCSTTPPSPGAAGWSN